MSLNTQGILGWEKVNKKKLSVILLISIIIGYIFLAGFHALIIMSVVGLRIEPKEFNQTNPDNETIAIDGIILIDNDHFFSVDIYDLILTISFYADDTFILEDSLKKDRIPRAEKTELGIAFSFLLDEEDLEDFMALNETSSLTIEASLSFTYAYIYSIDLTIKAEVDI